MGLLKKEQLAISKWQMAIGPAKAGTVIVLKLRIRETTSKKNLAANQRELEKE